MDYGRKPSNAPTLPRIIKRPQLERTANMHSGVATAPAYKKSKTVTSLLLTRWLSSKRASTPEIEDGWTLEDHFLKYGALPPLEEPVRVTRNTIKKSLIDDMRVKGGRLQLFEDLESKIITTDTVENLKNTCKPLEINALLLYASFLGQGDLISGLHRCHADLNYSQQELGLTALHLCAFSNSLSGVHYLISNGGNIISKKAHTPFHYAAFGDSYDVAKYFKQQGLSQESPLGEESVLHCAARNNSLNVLKLLAPNNPSLNRLDIHGNAPIHHVADRGDPACLEVLLMSGCQVDLPSKNGDTALHVAAAAGCADILELLIKNKANVAVKNQRGQTALHVAATVHCLECVETLVHKGNSDPNAEDNDGRTPLHAGLGKSLLSYDVTEMLITRRAHVNKADKYGFTPLHIAAINELSQCIDYLIQHGADLSARTKGGTTALAIVFRKTPSSLNIFKQKLDSSITLHQHASATGEVELRFDFHLLLEHQQQCEIGFLGTFVKEGCKEILGHPLCESFLHLKWQKIRKYYVGRLLFYLMYVLVLTAWVITALAHNCYNESHGQLDNLIMPLCANSTALNTFLYRHPIALDIEWYALIVLTAFEGMRKLTGILTYLSIRQFFTQAENMVEWCVILSVFATSFIYAGRTYSWQSHVGAFAVLCGWSNLMLMIGQLPMFGAYVAMFTSVQAQVFKLLLAYACLLVGFTASFCVIFPRSKSFSSPHTGLIKVLVMMTGELNFEELFFPEENEKGEYVDVGDTSWILLQVSAQLSFVLFLLFVTIVLMNLLVGIAVHDIKGLQKTAGLAKLVRQTKLICDVETALFLGIIPRRLTKFLRWTALILPSPLRAVITVRPLSPRETRLPRELLTSAYKLAREGKFISGTLTTSKRSNITAFSYLKNDIYSSVRRDENCEELLTGCNTKFKNDIAELKKICEENHKLIQDLVMALASDNRYNPDTDKI